MGWASKYIESLKAGYQVSFRPKGRSMEPRIKSGQLCTVTPNLYNISVNDIILCTVKSKQYLHFVKEIKNGKYKIGNNRGFINGWIGPESIHGKLIKIED